MCGCLLMNNIYINMHCKYNVVAIYIVQLISICTYTYKKMKLI